MERSPIVLRPWQKARLLRTARDATDAGLRTRCMIVVHSAAGWSRARIAKALGCGHATIPRVRRRWRQEGEAGLVDRREDNGRVKVDEAYLGRLREVLRGTAPDHGHRRPTWTQRLLIQTMHRDGHAKVSPASMSRALKRIGARPGRPKPTVGHLGWRKSAKNRRLSMIRRLIATPPANQAAVWEDEADIDLNPRIGPDWMLPGVQRQVVTPGKNIKRYLAGAMDAVSGRLTWVKGLRKDSGLFIELLKKLLRRYADKELVHVVLDNYRIHSSRRVRAWMEQDGGRIRLHFLPPYCPDDNRIERAVWRELHANVTRNHQCPTIDDLLGQATAFLTRYDHKAKGVSGLRKAI